MQNSVYDLEERTALFGESIIRYCRQMQKNVVTAPLVNQLIRSGTSVGANYCEANGASSKKDFRNKIFICKKEAKETMYWLRMLTHSDENLNEEILRLKQEAKELTLIFSKIAANTV